MDRIPNKKIDVLVTNRRLTVFICGIVASVWNNSIREKDKGNY